MKQEKIKIENFFNRAWIVSSIILGIIIFFLLVYFLLKYTGYDVSYFIKNPKKISLFINDSIYFLKIEYILYIFIGISSFLSAFLVYKNPFIFELENHYGSSRFATIQDIKKFNPSITDKTGMILGVFNGKPLYMNQTLSVMVFAPAGSGKSVSTTISNILSCVNDSILANDPKAELYDTTYKARSMIGEVFKFDWANFENSHKWNPVDLNNLPSHPIERERIVGVITAVLMGDVDISSDNSFWTVSAEGLLYCILIFTIYKLEKEKTSSSIPYVYDFISTLANNPEPYHILDLELSDEETEYLNSLKGEQKALLYHAFYARKNNFPQNIYTTLSSFASQDTKTLANIKASIFPKIKIFSDMAVRTNTSENDFNMEWLRGKDGKPITIYFVVPALEQDKYGIISALFIDLATRRLGSEKQETLKNARAVRFVLDEVAFMPPLQNIIRAPAIMRSYKVSYIYAFQDLAQIRDKWGEQKLKNLFTNTACKIILSQNSLDTVNELNSLIGKTTRKKTNTNTSNNRTHNSNNLLNDMANSLDDMIYGASSKHEDLESVDLFRPEELGSLKMGEQILLVQNSMNRPVFCNTAYYKKIPRFTKLLKQAEDYENKKNRN
ncbi:MAG: type IV secretory system conjugative DNA transfer family protein [Alphaproteobacteria bacterium]|jgi:type IV secretory pathway TraG/TraD family ATPase VirD4|nr:type IV secretory system conjugative DNA transfer family protein [Alphaproteobacteria bacterium]